MNLDLLGLDNLPNNLPHNLSNKIKDRAYIINLDKYFHIGTHWVALYVNNKTVTNFDSFWIEYSKRNRKIY